jgi:hypothetical protein
LWLLLNDAKPATVGLDDTQPMSATEAVTALRPILIVDSRPHLATECVCCVSVRSRCPRTEVRPKSHAVRSLYVCFFHVCLFREAAMVHYYYAVQFPRVSKLKIGRIRDNCGVVSSETPSLLYNDSLSLQWIRNQERSVATADLSRSRRLVASVSGDCIV